MQTVRVLLVDDSKSFLDSAQRFLTDFCRVEVVACALDGEQAVELAARLAPDLVLMDVSMPGISGIEASRRIRNRVGAPRIVLVSLDSEQYAEAQTTDVPVDAWVSKKEFTARIPELIETVTRWRNEQGF